MEVHRDNLSLGELLKQAGFKTHADTGALLHQTSRAHPRLGVSPRIGFSQASSTEQVGQEAISAPHPQDDA